MGWRVNYCQQVFLLSIPWYRMLAVRRDARSSAMGHSSIKGKLILEMQVPASASIVDLYLTFLSTPSDLMMLHFSFVFCSLTGKPHLRWHCSIQKALYHKFQVTASIGYPQEITIECSEHVIWWCLDYLSHACCDLVFIILLCLCMY